MDIIDTPSPNFGPRRDGLTPGLVVLHYTAMDSSAAALERLCTPEHEVSAHYLIRRDGRVHRLVAEDQRAWHAGAGEWGGRGDVNSRSIGIELTNRGQEPFAARQIDSLEVLLAGILSRWEIPPQGVIGHACMAPGRKSDPGPRFDWRRLARRGLAVWPDEIAGAPPDEIAGAPPDAPPEVAPETLSDTRSASPPDPQDFAAAARAFGYPVSDGTLDAFRQRFRPAALGTPLHAADIAMLRALAKRFAANGA